MDSKNYDVMIIGGGASGMAAGMYLARANKRVCIVESVMLGGVLGTLLEIDNYPGFPNASGADIASAMATQVEGLGAEIIYGVPHDIKLADKTMVVDDTLYSASNIILAMGAGNQKLGLHNEDKLVGKGLSYCATCDGAFFKGKPTVIVGGTLHTLSDALYLEGVASETVMLVPNDRLLAPPKEIEKLSASKVKVMYNTALVEIKQNDKGKASGVLAKAKDKKDDINIEAEGVFVALGYTPNTQSVYGQVGLDDKGYIVVDSHMKTNIVGVYAIGDIRTGSVKQVVASCSDGMIASMSIISGK